VAGDAVARRRAVAGPDPSVTREAGFTYSRRFATFHHRGCPDRATRRRVSRGMMKYLLASLIAVPALSLAQPAPPTPPRPPPPGSRPHVCKQEGTPLFEIDQNKSAVTKLYVDGAFDKQTFDDKGKLTSEASGCMQDKDLRRVTKEIHAAPWKVQTDAIHCMAISNDISVYKINGAVVYSERLCG